MKIPLMQGAYEARSPIANAQVCINLYPEPNPKDAPFPITHYPSPGVSVLSDYTGTFSGACRGIYDTSLGNIIAVFDTTVINWVGPSQPPIVLGNLVGNSANPVSMCDNGATLVIVDGSADGYMVALDQLGTPNSLQQIDDPAFYGSPRVDYIDTFMVFTIPGTGTMYTTTSGVVTPFDSTYAAAKEGWNDLLVTAACLHDNIWLLGNSTTEVWYNAGGTTFPFARMPNSILQQGCVATYSAVIADNAIYWLSQDRWGRNMCMRGEGYAARRVSTFAVEDIWSTYPSLSDAIGMAYQLGGHETIGFYFPTAGAWWSYDASTQMWHQRTYNGLSEPWLPYCIAGWGSIAYGGYPNAIIAGDRTGPRILLVSRNNYTDEGVPITRQRSWAHNQGDSGQRIHHARFSLDMNGTNLSPDGVNLDWSDDAGQSYGTPVPQTVQASGYPASYGQYQWRRLGYARDRVYRATFSAGGEFAINGAYLDVIPQGT